MSAGILALDTARNVGWAFAKSPADEPQWGSVRIVRPSTDAGEWFYQFERWLIWKIDRSNPRYVVYMNPIRTKFDSSDRLQKLYGLAAVVRLVCARLAHDEDREITAKYAEDAAVCRSFTGKGRWGGRDNKKAAVIRVAKQYGWDTGTDDDAADALALLVFSEHKLYPKEAGKRPLVLRAA